MNEEIFYSSLETIKAGYEVSAWKGDSCGFSLASPSTENKENVDFNFTPQILSSVGNGNPDCNSFSIHQIRTTI